MAWLAAKPKGSKQTRQRKYRALDEEHPVLMLPDLEEASYLFQMFQEAGVCSSNGMGIVPLSWQEIDSWLSVTLRQPLLWERLLVKEMSEAYVAEWYEAEDPARPAPYSRQVISEEQRNSIDKRLRNFFGASKARKENK